MINQGKACPYCSVDPQCSHRQDTVSPFRAVEDPPCDDGGPGRGCRRQILHHPGSIPAVPPKGVLVFPAPRGSGRSPAGCGPMVPFSKTSGARALQCQIPAPGLGTGFCGGRRSQAPDGLPRCCYGRFHRVVAACGGHAGHRQRFTKRAAAPGWSAGLMGSFAGKACDGRHAVKRTPAVQLPIFQPALSRQTGNIPLAGPPGTAGR